MDSNPLSDVPVNVLPHSVGCLFIFLIFSFVVQTLFSLMYSQLLTFSFVSLAWGDIYDKILLWGMSEILLPRIFMVWGLTYKSLAHFELIPVCGIRRWSSFLGLHVSAQFSQHHLLNKLSLAYCMYLLSLFNINWP